MPRPLPDSDSRWFCTIAEWPTAVADVVADKRFTLRARLRFLNTPVDLDPRMPGRGRLSRPTADAEEFGRLWTKQARIPMEWLNDGSVWRVLPRIGWMSGQHLYGASNSAPGAQPFLNDLRVISRITEDGTVIPFHINADGSLEDKTSSFYGREGTVHHFIHHYCRLWASTEPAEQGSYPQHPERPDDPAELFPEILYTLGYLVRPEPPAQKPKRAKKPLRKRTASGRKKRKQRRPTAWERLGANFDE